MMVSEICMQGHFVEGDPSEFEEIEEIEARRLEEEQFAEEFEKSRRVFGESVMEVFPYDDEVLDERDFEEDAEVFWESSDGKRNKEIGRRGEQAAARYLRLMGFEILERNWVSPWGEADIIATDGDTLVFVEVKTRTNINKGFPSESVTPEKRRRYEMLAAWYLRDHGVLDISVRFDVIGILVVAKDRAMIKHYVNAFGQEF